MQTHELTALPDIAGRPATTVLMGIDPADPKVNRLTLANAWKEATGGTPPPEAVERLLDASADDWNRNAEGLAVLSGPDGSRVLWLPWTPPTTACSDTLPLIAPLLPLLDDERPFAVVALQLGEWRVLMCNRRTFEPLAFDAPANIDEATAVVQDPVPGGSAHAHRTSSSQTTGATRVHMQGFGHENRKENDADLYFRELDKALAATLSGPIPVVVVGSAKWVHRFSEKASFAPIATVEHNPSDLDDAELHALAWSHARSHIQHDPDALSEKLGAAGSDGRRSTDRSEIAEMAVAGGIDTLVVPAGHATAPDVNKAVLHTLETGGTAVTVEEGGPFHAVTALLRWSN